MEQLMDDRDALAVTGTVAAAAGAGLFLRWRNHGVTVDTAGLSLSKMPADFHKYSRNGTPRDPATIDTLVVHVTGVAGGFGLTKQQLAAAGGVPSRARGNRYKRAAYGAVYSPKDRALWIQYPPSVWLWSSDGANRTSVALAYDGLFPPDTIEVLPFRTALRRTVEAYRSAGCPLRFVESHRQHDGIGRGADPGAEIWSRVVVPMLGPLRLEQRDRTTGTGKVNPPSWQPARVSMLDWLTA